VVRKQNPLGLVDKMNKNEIRDKILKELKDEIYNFNHDLTLWKTGNVTKNYKFFSYNDIKAILDKVLK